MAGFELSFEVMGDKQVARGFSRFANEVKDLRDAFREIVKDFRDTIEKKQFESEGGYGSGGWKPLATSTLRQKASKGYPSTILVATGRMKRSLTGKTRDTIEEIKPLSILMGTKAGYARYHQKGTRYMPARPVIELTEGDKTRWTKIIHRYMVKFIKSEFKGLMPTAGEGGQMLRGINQ